MVIIGSGSDGLVMVWGWSLDARIGQHNHVACYLCSRWEHFVSLQLLEEKGWITNASGVILSCGCMCVCVEGASWSVK